MSPMEDDMKLKLDKKDWSEWYNTVVEAAGLSDKRYPIKGMNIWLPYGWKIMMNIDKYIRELMEKTNHEEYSFPLLIRQTEFNKEAEHIKGFNSEVYWVTHGGENKLDIPSLLRPTSETAMYPMFSLWVRNHADLPLKTYQIVNVFRYETKMTRSFIRVREIHFFEAHTVHTDFEDAEHQIVEDLDIMEEIARRLCLPHLKLRRPKWDMFAGADYSVGVDSIMPTGRTLQIGGIHQYKDNFARAYNIMYEDVNGQKKYAHQTTYGMSERLVGTLISVHGDNRGLILPPDVAPYQVVIVPIFRKDNVDAVSEYARSVKEMLDESGLRVNLDDRDLRPGNKYYHWELRGVPIRVEVGPRDMQGHKAVVVPRDTGEKMAVSLDDLVNTIVSEMDQMKERLLGHAREDALSKMAYYPTIEEMPENPEGMVIGAPWCGEDNCGHQMEDRLDMNLLGVPLENYDARDDVDMHRAMMAKFNVDESNLHCAVCGARAKGVAILARTH